MLITLLMYSVRVSLSIVGAGYMVDSCPRIRIHASVHRMVLTMIRRTCPLEYFVPAIFLFSIDRGVLGTRAIRKRFSNNKFSHSSVRFLLLRGLVGNFFTRLCPLHKYHNKYDLNGDSHPTRKSIHFSKQSGTVSRVNFKRIVYNLRQNTAHSLIF
jgi:hypothetical protein